MERLLFLWVLVGAVWAGRTYTNTLEDCNEFADLFSNTCDNDSGAASLASTASEDITCTIDQNCAGTSGANNACTWARKLCVTCSNINNEAYIRVQSNGLPPHCYKSPMDAISELDIDFEVKFQPLAGSSFNHEATSQNNLNSLICDIQVTQANDIPSASDYTATGSTQIDTAAGIAINGVVLLNGISAEGVDPLYPAEYGMVTDIAQAAEKFDACLAHPNPHGQYHYHSLSPCMVDFTVGDSSEPCEMITTCNDNPFNYAMGSFADDTHDELFPVGIAKDGYIIWGPYNNQGSEWTSCDVDICNGAFVDGTNYGYVSTSFHPYFLGCWGPGNNETDNNGTVSA